jgi:hypothetical protein
MKADKAMKSAIQADLEWDSDEEKRQKKRDVKGY